jgi:hypothetical protein
VGVFTQSEQETWALGVIEERRQVSGLIRGSRLELYTQFFWPTRTKSSDNLQMQMTNSRAGLVFVLALTLAACHPSQRSDRPSQPAQTKTDPAVETKTGTDPKPTERPSLTGRIGNVSLYPVPNNREDLAVSLVVSVTNVGTPSTVQGWNLEVTSPGHPVPAGLAPVHVNGVVEMPGSPGKKVDLGKEDLALKTASAPMAKNAHINGILTFVIPKTTEAQLSNNSTRLVLHFKDALGNPYQTPPGVLGGKASSGK